MVRLEPRGVVREQRIRGRVRLVEAVARELLHQVEDLVRLLAREAVLRGALGEDLAVLRHFLGLLLAHRATQQVGAAQRIAADDLRHLHHLLLVDHDAVGLFQNRLDARVRILHGFATVLARAEARDQIHRTRTIQRNQRDDVLETVGLRVLQHALHAAAFQLEHGDGIRFLENRERRGVVERHLRERPVLFRRIEAADVALGPVENGQRGQAQKVELHEADSFDVVLVVLAHDAAFVTLRIERAEVGQLAGRDQHAARVHADVTRQAFHALRELEQLVHFVFVVEALLQQRLFLHRVGDGHMLAGLERNQLRDAVREHVAEIEHAADVAHGCLRGHRAERRDLRHGVGAVLLLHVLDHAIAAVLAEVDVEVGHRHPLRIQKTFEQQVVAQRIEVGNAERVRDERARARAPARPDRHAVVLCPVDEVRDNQEVAGEAHLDDRAAFEVETRVIRLALRVAFGLIGVQLLETLLQPFLRQLHQIVVERHAVRRREQRQLRLAELEREVAALCNFDGVRERGRNVREHRGHFVLRAEILVRRKALLATRIRKHVALGNAHARFVRGEVVGRHVLQRMRRDDRQLERSRQCDRLLHVRLRARLPAALQFDIERVRKELRPTRCIAPCGFLVARRERDAHVAVLRARQRKQSLGEAAFEPRRLNLRASAILVREPRLRQQFAQVQIAGLVLDQQQKTRRLVAIVGIRDPDIAARNGFDPFVAGFLVETDETECVAEIGERERALTVFGSGGDDVVEAHDAIGNREFGVNAEMDEAGI